MVKDTIQISAPKGAKINNKEIEFDSKQGGNRGSSGRGSELPAMASLSANTNNGSVKDSTASGGPAAQQPSHQYPTNQKIINSMQANSSNRMSKGPAMHTLAQRSQNFESEPSS